ncbi:MAG TPA: GAF domain-containing protein, partial [Gaiellaceae bacterium]
MVLSDITRLIQLAGLSDAAIFDGVLEYLALALGVALAIHLLLDIFVLRGRRRAGELAVREHQLAAVAELSSALTLAGDKESIARTVLDTLNDLVGFDFSGLVLVDEDGSEARGVIGRAAGTDVDWFPSVRLDLENEVSGIRQAVETRAIFAVEDAPGAPEVSAELVERAGLKSLVFFPLEGERWIVGVLVAGSTSEFRAFRPEQLSLMRMLAAEGTLALERMESVGALERGLERERLVAEISRRVRAELDIDRLIDAALAETAKALDVERCFIRLGNPGSAAPLRAEWRREGIKPITASATPFLSVSNLALRERKTAAIADVENDQQLDDDSLGGREALLELGSRAVLSAPIVLFESVIGALAAHASVVRRWSDDDIAFIEAIARELGIALHTAGLIEENKRQLEEQNALLVATEAMTNELELDSVLAQKLAGGRAELVGPSSSKQVMKAAVHQATQLLEGDAALMLELGSRAVLSAPIILFESVIGALAAHASVVRRWSDDDIAFIEAIARELGIALHTAG